MASATARRHPASRIRAVDEEVTVTGISRRGQAIGAVVALVVPTSFWILALLVDDRVVPYELARSLFNLFGLIGWISLFLLGPIGIVIAGRSSGVRGVVSWIAVFIVAQPIVVFDWFLGVASLGGSLGNPF
jgi:hypothetical protein